MRGGRLMVAMTENGEGVRGVLVQGMMQLLVGVTLSAMFLLFQVQASPYADIADNFLASTSSFGLVKS